VYEDEKVYVYNCPILEFKKMKIFNQLPLSLSSYIKKNLNQTLHF